MNSKNPRINKILNRYREIAVLAKVNSLLAWDLNVNLPVMGAASRAEQSSAITKLIAERWQDSNFKKEIEEFDETLQKLTHEEAAILRNLKRTAKFYYKIPEKIIVEFSEVTSRAFMVWQDAKNNDKFKDFLPLLTKVVDLNKLIAEKLGFEDNPYDALLDLYEPELTTKTCRTVFKKIQPHLTDLVKKIEKKKDVGSVQKLVDGTKKYPVEIQKELANFVIRKMGYDLESGRMDISSHPFTETLGAHDVRITNRYKETDFRESLMGAMHEAGHALYEQGVLDDYENTPLEGGVSLGIHESQSRFWENQVGRSNSFVKFMTPVFQSFYPKQLGRSESAEIFKVVNSVRPSLIRTDADEVTYNLHIALRFEIEEALINERIKTSDLPEIWREKMREYLGIEPNTDREGVLQDVHWSNGMFGYFPTYTLGNLYAAQFTNQMNTDIQLEKLVENGNFGVVREWLQKNIHKYGSLYVPKDLCMRVTGEDLNPDYFMEYIKTKFSEIYKL